MTTTITSTDTTTITTQPRKICSPSFEPPQTMKTTEEMAHEYAEALDDIADLLDMPTGGAAYEIVEQALQSLNQPTEP
jgi:hypothetical protein